MVETPRVQGSMKKLLAIVFLSFTVLIITAWPLLYAWGQEPAPLEGRTLSIILKAPPPSEEWQKIKETPDERFERLSIIARAHAEEAEFVPEGWPWGREEFLALLLATSYEEGWRWSADVHAGLVRGDKGKSICLMQIQQHKFWVPMNVWKAAAGRDLESTRICVGSAGRILGYYARRCIGGWRYKDLESSYARIITGYGTGTSCDPRGRKWAWDRAYRSMRWLKEIKDDGQQ